MATRRSPKVLSLEGIYIANFRDARPRIVNFAQLSKDPIVLLNRFTACGAISGSLAHCEALVFIVALSARAEHKLATAILF